MSDGVGRDSPSGSVVVRKGTIAVPQTAVAGSATASASASFSGARVGDMVQVNPLALLQGASGIWQALCLASDVITIVFGTGGAALTITAQTMTCTVGQW
jgi:hypothetical protein